MKLAIIVPEYNEGLRAVETIKRIREVCDDFIILIDDGSTVKNFDLIISETNSLKNVLVLRHILNLGKGSAMKTGIEACIKLGYDTVLFLDADGQHNPNHILEFKSKLTRNSIVFGYRELDKKMPLVRKIGNKFAGFLIGMMFGIRKKDLLSGYLGFKLSVYDKIKWTSTRYGIETEMAAKVGRNKLSFSEIKVDTIYIDKYKGVSLIDAIKIFFQLPLWYFTK